MENNILVIGNGYDLAHKLNTRYSDFIECVNKKGLNNDEFTRVISSNGFISCFLEYAKIFSWIDCEREIKSIINSFDTLFQEQKDRTFTNRSVGSLAHAHIKKFNLFDNVNSSSFNNTYFSYIYGFNKSEIIKFLKSQLDDLIKALEIYISCVVEKDIENKEPIKHISEINPRYIVSF